MRTKKGFTLAELIAVTTMVGILVAVTTPTVLNSATDVSDNAVRTSLEIVREAIDTHIAQNGTYPDGTSDVAFKAALKPWLRGVLPASPVGCKDNIVKMSSHDPLVADNTTGWMYNGTTGEFILNCTNLSEDSSTTYDRF